MTQLTKHCKQASRKKARALFRVPVPLLSGVGLPVSPDCFSFPSSRVTFADHLVCRTFFFFLLPNLPPLRVAALIFPLTPKKTMWPTSSPLPSWVLVLFVFSSCSLPPARSNSCRPYIVAAAWDGKRVSVSLRLRPTEEKGGIACPCVCVCVCVTVREREILGIAVFSLPPGDGISWVCPLPRSPQQCMMHSWGYPG